MILRYCRLFQCPVLHKMPLSRGVWIVSGDVWMGSEGVWGCVNTEANVSVMSVAMNSHGAILCLLFSATSIRPEECSHVPCYLWLAIGAPFDQDITPYGGSNRLF